MRLVTAKEISKSTGLPVGNFYALIQKNKTKKYPFIEGNKLDIDYLTKMSKFRSKLKLEQQKLYYDITEYIPCYRLATIVSEQLNLKRNNLSTYFAKGIWYAYDPPLSNITVSKLLIDTTRKMRYILKHIKEFK